MSAYDPFENILQLKKKTQIAKMITGDVARHDNEGIPPGHLVTRERLAFIMRNANYNH